MGARRGARLAWRSVLAALLLALAGSAGAAAEHMPIAQRLGVSELRMGLYAHDVPVFNEGAGGVEAGANLAVEAVFQSPGVLRWLLAPRPFAQFSMNTAGETNFGGVGLAWTTPRWRDRIFGEFGLGYVLHDGVTELPSLRSSPDRQRLAEQRVIFGSRDLFRTTFAVGAELSPHWDAALVFEHLSHGQILHVGKNEGLDNFGLRVSYRPAPES